MDTGRKKIGLYGGSFNPIHAGHIQVALWTLQYSDIDELWMMVTPLNPLKTGKTDNNFTQRYTQAKDFFAKQKNILLTRNGELLFQQDKLLKRIHISNYEFYLPAPNYTINTLLSLHKDFPSFEFSIVIGEDNWLVFQQWKNWESIINQYTIYVYPREGGQRIDIKNIASHKNVIYFKDAPHVNISSTQLRKQQS